MDHQSIVVAVPPFIFDNALLHFRSDFSNSDRLLLTGCGFVQLFAQIPHSMDGNYNGLGDLFQDIDSIQW